MSLRRFFGYIVCFLCLTHCVSSKESHAQETSSWRHKRSLADWFASFLSDEVCYHDDGIGCFSNIEPYDYAQNLLPEAPHTLGLEYLLYTRDNRKVPETLLGSRDSILTSSYNGSKDTKVILHGFQDSGRKPWVTGMKDELLKRDDMNVIVVDWQEGARDINYGQVAANIRVVGAMVAKLLKVIHKTTLIPYRRMHLIGQSLGAHAAGFAGERINGLGRITGLDPAGPLFERQPNAVRLDATDANFVDIIHTDGDSITNLAFGLDEATGDVDFYPNGGSKQPGCKIRNLASRLMLLFQDKGINRLKSDVICSHMRVIDLFTESINSKCKFVAFKCHSKDDFNRNKCSNPCSTTAGDHVPGNNSNSHQCAEMGYNADTRPHQKGVYYLRTWKASPFCMKN